MKYLMLIYGNEDIWNSLPPEALTRLIDEVDGFNDALRESGELPGGARGWFPGRARSGRWVARSW
ncbi:hypothetical protein JOL79_21845 [Microbispora sp. RL4-1S]|uniref:Uncharacterized protein n=1 Tax=Microbispora oryzae TaxID=2806554 RepID=A0A940WJ38_9ACTN|nr:hypothetical protein [Microbispora oryzae]MBP2706456.1 hypothetical protein [Microbispora oryzae]